MQYTHALQLFSAHSGGLKLSSKYIIIFLIFILFSFFFLQSNNLNSILFFTYFSSLFLLFFFFFISLFSTEHTLIEIAPFPPSNIQILCLEVRYKSDLGLDRVSSEIKLKRRGNHYYIQECRDY